MTTVTIRRAEEADRPVLLKMAERLQEGVASWRDPANVRSAVVDWVDASLSHRDDDDSAVLVAERTGEIQGLVCVSERAHFTGEVDTYIGELVVAKTAEGAGIGRALVEAAESWGRDRGRRRVTVDTGAANWPARRFYEALGYSEEDITVSRALDG